jgi:PBSX family phage terminase large subunit
MGKKTQSIKLTDLIAPAFYNVYWDIVEEKHTYYNLYGGRGSTKSSFISVMIVLGIMQDENANAICYRKVGETVGDSVFEQVCWAIEMLGAKEEWHITVNPYRCTYKPTGQKIIFKGLDKAKKQKSAKVSKGYFKYLWFEELDEFNGDEEIRMVQQSILRGGDKFVVFKSFNPPISNSNWANQYVSLPHANTLNHKSTYLEVPKKWLGQTFIDDAEDLKATNENMYKHEYLGIPIGTGGEVFNNIVTDTISDEMVHEFDRIYMGIDWGWYPDPFMWTKMHYDTNKRTLYIFDEYKCNKQSNLETYQYLVENKDLTPNDLITADSAEKKSIADYKQYGAFIRGAEKGNDSVRYSMKWLQSLNAIVIDPERCPYANWEFTHYEYEKTANDEIINSFPDKNNHAIDSVRYAMERIWKKRGL